MDGSPSRPARPGGRVHTVRRGTVSEEDGPGQTAAFDDGLYFNAGPMRISHHHHTTLAYCRELQVGTEVFVPDCESAYLAQTRGPLGGRRIRLREARADFEDFIQSREEIVECYAMSGEWDYLLRIAVRDVADGAHVHPDRGSFPQGPDGVRDPGHPQVGCEVVEGAAGQHQQRQAFLDRNPGGGVDRAVAPADGQHLGPRRGLPQGANQVAAGG